MLKRKTLVTLTLAEGVVLWLTVAVGGAFAEEPSRTIDLAIVFGCGFVFAVICVIAMYLADLYDVTSVRRAAAFRERLPRALGVTLSLIGALYALLPSARAGIRTLLPYASGALLALLAARAAFGRMLRRGQPERVLVLGEGPLATRIVNTIDGQQRGEHVIVGSVSLGNDGSDPGRVLDEALRSARPDRIVVAGADRHVPLPIHQLLEGRLHGIAVEDGVLFYERLAGKMPLESLTARSVAFGDGFGEARLHAAFARAVGVVAALIGLIALAPFLALVALGIRFTSRGPIFFVQQRVGRHGRPYGLIKLRTMYVNPNPPSEWARDNNHRITPIGRWLRRFRIDELPQLVNVLKGDMNLVGPRPHPLSNHLLFMERIPHYPLRCLVLPGITGWAQVRYGYANNLEQEIEKMRFDLFYIRNVSIWLDLRILIETVLVVLRGESGKELSVSRVSTELSRTGS